MARARKEVREELIEEPVTDIAGLIAFLEQLRAEIPEEDRVSEEEIRNMDDYLYGDPKAL